jgi:hypothetical protein
MSDWYEVFDYEQVQQSTRERVRRTILVLVVGLAGTLTVAPLIVLQLSGALLGLSIVAAIGGGFVLVASRRLLSLRRVVWCVKLSVHRIVGYDYARRKTVLPWPDVERVDVDESGLLIVGHPGDGRPPPVLRIPVAFPDYPRLSHRVVEYAEAHGVPICIDGRPWQLVNLVALYPFMAGQSVVERPEGPIPGSDTSN